MNVLEGQLRADGRRFGIVASRTNDIVVSRLLDGALDAFRRLGAAEGAVTVVKVPGSWEIPLALRDLGKVGGFDALVALGAVIRGGTPHFDYVASEVSKGVAQIGLSASIPVVFGVLTTDTIEQAIERAGTKSGNKGFDAAMSAIEMANIFKQIR